LPTYEYACTACGHRLDAVQKFTDDPLTVCPECGGALRKVFGAIGIVLKGSGFYKTDSRPSGGRSGGEAKEAKESKGSDTPSSDSKSDTSPKPESTKSGSDSSSTKESKPAATAAS